MRERALWCFLSTTATNPPPLTRPFFLLCAAYDLAKRHYYVSLRSASDAVDVSVICKAMGGGGHKRAGGFTCERLEDVLVFADGTPVGGAEGGGAAGKRAKAGE